MKRCSRCDQWLDRSAFTPNASRRDGLQTFCRDCQRSYMREHYQANTEYYVAKARLSNAKRNQALRRLLRELKDVPCSDCGQLYPPWVMDFDHVAGDKLFNVGQAVRTSAAVILSEVAKCEVVCANCHRDRTYKRMFKRP